MKREKTMKAGPRTARGFSLGEVLLSIFILTAGILPILAALVNAFNVSRDSRDTIIAAGLAQEGVELILNIRDNAMLLDPSTPFANFVPGNRTCKVGKKVVEDILLDPTDLIPCPGAGDFNLVDNNPSAGAFYSPNGVGGPVGAPTKFYRKIFIDYVPGLPLASASVTSAVYWNPSVYVPNNANDADANCTPANSCVRSKMVLRPWKE